MAYDTKVGFGQQAVCILQLVKVRSQLSKLGCIKDLAQRGLKTIVLTDDRGQPAEVAFHLAEQSPTPEQVDRCVDTLRFLVRWIENVPDKEAAEFFTIGPSRLNLDWDEDECGRINIGIVRLIPGALPELQYRITPDQGLEYTS
jgi:hypothetical protein